MPHLVDTHCHLDQYRVPASIAARAALARVAIIAVTGLPSHFAAGVRPVQSLKGVRLALGLHPLLAPHAPEELRAFERFAATTSYIGEVGLDFSRHGRDTRDAQLVSFQVVLGTLGELARGGRRRFVTIHSRGAERAVLEAVAEAALGPVVLHWYSGPLSAADEAVAEGHFFSVNPAMLRSRSGQRLLERVPHDRVLLESDGPYADVDGRPAEPADLAATVHELGAVWGHSPQRAAERLHANLRTLLRTLGFGTVGDGPSAS